MTDAKDVELSKDDNAPVGQASYTIQQIRDYLIGMKAKTNKKEQTK